MIFLVQIQFFGRSNCYEVMFISAKFKVFLLFPVCVENNKLISKEYQEE